MSDTGEGVAAIPPERKGSVNLEAEYTEPVADLRRALNALRLEVPRPIADDVSAKAERVIAIAMKVEGPQGDDE